MSKILVIVESPTKAKTINKYLGSNYIVKSSVGHIRDLPTNTVFPFNHKINNDKKFKINESFKPDKKTMLVHSMGINPWNNWQANYQILPGKEIVVSELKNLASKVDHIYLATDLDREGEAIAWHLREIIGGHDSRFSRVIFNEITQKSIQQAFKKTSELNINYVNAQQARRFMDRIVGYMISPLLWKKVARGLSAGRVQSVAVRLIIEREREIKSFIPKEYWEINGNFTTPKGENLLMKISSWKNKKFYPTNFEQTQAAIITLQKVLYKVRSREDKTTISKPLAPFITSTLQRSASMCLGFSVQKTMLIAQHLYEKGFITYMRTDSTNLSNDAIEMARIYIQKNFGENYLPYKPNKYVSQKKSQEAHEAIRPSNINVVVEQLNDMKADVKKLYYLIWCQFIGCQMASAQYNSTTLKVCAEDFELKAMGRTLLFDGWIKVTQHLRKPNEDHTLPMVNVGEYLSLKKLIPSQHFTKPLTRFNESSLVRELEKRGIGRPSTYASIISTIQDRGYVEVKNHRFYAKKIGEIVTDRLKENFCELMDYNFTASMEDRLDQIANNKADWKKVLDSFFKNFSYQLDVAEEEPKKGGMRPNQMVLTSIDCPNCGRKMGIRTASTGSFLGCSGYILPFKERCRNTINLTIQNEVFNILEDENNALRSCRRCQKCNTIMDSYITDNKCKLYICGNNPDCNNYEIEKGTFHINNHDLPVIECEKCNSNMYSKIGRFGKYMSCMNENCKNTRKILSNGEIAKPKEEPIPLPELMCKHSSAYFVLRNGSLGIFLAANTFPKSHETRAPLIEELQRFIERLPEKLKYLTEAPSIDTEGNKTLVHFNRKMKQQYIVSKKDGKLTGWSMFYIDGKWQKVK